MILTLIQIVLDGAVYVWNADTGEETYIYERPLGVNNNKSATFDDVPIVNSIVYHPFDHIVAFSGIGKHPTTGLPLPVCLYKFDKNTKSTEESSESNENTFRSIDTTNSLKTPSFFSAKNQYKDKLSPLDYKSLPLKEMDDITNDNKNKNDEKNTTGRASSHSPEKIKSMLYELDQFLQEKENN